MRKVLDRGVISSRESVFCQAVGLIYRVALQGVLRYPEFGSTARLQPWKTTTDTSKSSVATPSLPSATLSSSSSAGKMTTAHRPTFDPARGKETLRGPAYHQRLLPAHTQLKFR